MKRLAIVVALAGVAAADVAPDPEVAKVDVQVALPAIPTFELVVGGDSARGVKELRVAGASLIDTKVTVRGYIIWIYDCVEAVRTAKETKAQTQKRIDADPTLCERPKFYLGDRKDTPRERGLWVVDVPRLPNKLERENMTPAELAEEYPASRVPPKIAVGDYVELAGDFKRSSPHSERNSDGLLVYGTLTHTTPSKTAGKAVARSEPALPTVTPAQHSTVQHADSVAYRNSIKSANEGTKALAAKQLDAAIDAYRKATDSYHDNALAWYGLGAAYAQRGDWDNARDGFDTAVQIAPDVAMYQMWLGIARYEAAVAHAREDQARRENRTPAEVQVDLAAIDFERAIEPLVLAITIEPKLWRAQYYLARILRAKTAPHLAAEHFGLAIAANPREPGPYIALAELYRRWEYSTEAIDVATQGTANVSAGSELSDVFYVLGMAYDDTLDEDKAILAFSKAFELRRDNYMAQFQRGQAYYRKRDFVNAKRDLEAFSKSAGKNLQFARQQATAMLMDIAAQQAVSP